MIKRHFVYVIHIEFVHNWRKHIYDIFRVFETNLLVIDDYMCEASDSNKHSRMFTKYSDHCKLTVIYYVEHVFDKGNRSRTVSINSHYQVIFRNRRDASQFRVLACQMALDQNGWLLDAFEDATRQPFGYLLISNHLHTANKQLIRSRIMPCELTSFYSESSFEMLPPSKSLQHSHQRLSNRKRLHPH